MSAAKQQGYRRRQLIVNRSMQYRFAGMLLLIAFVLTMIALAASYLTLWGTLQMFELGDDPVTVALFTTVGLSMAVELIIVAPFVVWLAVMMSHKVAGPLVRILRALTEMSKGNFDIQVNLRKGDALPELADAVNGLAASLRRRPS